jgi:cardiolipin synthase
LIALDLFPLWAGAIVIARDVAVGLAGALLVRRGIRIDVRKLGKYATFTLMWGMPMIAWGNAGLPLADLMAVLGWIWFPVGVVEYYAVTVLYVRDAREALARRAAASAST